MSDGITLDEFLDALAKETGIERMEKPVSCDSCRTRLRSDQAHSQYVEPMVMVLCEECASEAGWLED